MQPATAVYVPAAVAQTAGNPLGFVAEEAWLKLPGLHPISGKNPASAENPVPARYFFRAAR